MIISTCGFGSTGSSVISDYLSEFDNFQILDSVEFCLAWLPDGLIDLEYHLMNPHGKFYDSILAIKRYLRLIKHLKRRYDTHGISGDILESSAQEFINNITQTSWYWQDLEKHYSYRSINFIQTFLIDRVIPFFERRMGQRYNGYPLIPVSLSVKPENFYGEAKKHINSILRFSGYDLSKPIVLDQAFSGDNPQACFPFFDDPYAVVVDRDPRDNYVFAKTKLVGMNHFMPIDSVEDYISFYSRIRKNQPYRNSSDRILRIQFEDMIYEYEDTTRKIRKFFNLSLDPRPRSVFDPSLSIANTQVFRRFPEYYNDVKKIEKNLKDYLFDFDKYPIPPGDGKMFYGKSPKRSRR